MKILFTWIGAKTFSKYRESCVNRAKLLYPEAQFISITDQGQFFPNFKIITSKSYKEKIVSALHVEPKLLRHFFSFCDYARFLYLIENEDTLYLDTDTYCIKRIPTLDSGMIGAIPGQLDVLYNNDNPQKFSEILSKRQGFSTLMDLVRYFDYKREVVDFSEFFSHKDEKFGYSREKDGTRG